MKELTDEISEPPAATCTEVNDDEDGNIWNLHDQMVNEQQCSRRTTARDEFGYPVELRQYLATPTSSRTVNPLEDWELLRSQYPTLYKIAMKYLSILATSVPCERLFSRAGNILRKARNRLSGIHMDQLLFLSNVDEGLWFEEYVG